MNSETKNRAARGALSAEGEHTAISKWLSKDNFIMFLFYLYTVTDVPLIVVSI